MLGELHSRYIGSRRRPSRRLSSTSSTQRSKTSSTKNLAGLASRRVELLGATRAQTSEALLQVEVRMAEAVEMAKKLAAEAWVAEEARLAKEVEHAVLRWLTPEQEAAVAKVAQRIGEVAAAAEAAPEEERGDGRTWATYGGGAIKSLLDHTPLIDLDYLVALTEGGGVMPCGRQNVPPPRATSGASSCGARLKTRLCSASLCSRTRGSTGSTPTGLARSCASCCRLPL